MLSNYSSIKSLHDFGQNLILNNQLDLAEKVYIHVSQLEDEEIVKMGIYELASILELKSNKKAFELRLSNSIINDSFFNIKTLGDDFIDMRDPSIINIVNLYDSLITVYNHPKAEYKLALLKLKSNYSYENILNHMIKLERQSLEIDTKFNSAINIIDLKISHGFANNNLLNEIDNFKKIYNKDNQSFILELKKNQVYFYQKEFDIVRENLKNSIKTIPKDNHNYNNYMDGLIFSMMFNNNNIELELFSESLYCIKKMQYKEALEKLSQLSLSTNPSVVNISLYFQSYLYIQQKEYAMVDFILESIYIQDIFSQLTVLLWAEVDDYIHNDKNSAIDKYLDFLDNYESSIFYEDIRIR